VSITLIATYYSRCNVQRTSLLPFCKRASPDGSDGYLVHVVHALGSHLVLCWFSIEMLTETCKCGAPFLPRFPTRDVQVRFHSSSQFQSSTVCNSCRRLRILSHSEKVPQVLLVVAFLVHALRKILIGLSKWGLLKHQHCLAANKPRHPDTLPALHCQACVFPRYTSVLLFVPQSLHSVCKVLFFPTFLPLPS
jgi:hypothetical protein